MVSVPDETAETILHGTASLCEAVSCAAQFHKAASLCGAVSLTAVELPQPPRQLAAKALDVVGAVDLRLTRKHRFLTACRGTRDVVARQSHAKRTLCDGLRGAHKHVSQ